jgi:hypothetical protein
VATGEIVDELKESVNEITDCVTKLEAEIGRQKS